MPGSYKWSKKPPFGVAHRWIVTIGLALSMLFIFCVQAWAQKIEVPENPVAGYEVIFNKRCVQCHAVYGNGGRIGRDLGKSLSPLRPAGIFAKMWNHTPEMGELLPQPLGLPVFSEQEMTQFMAFIYFLNYLDEPGEPAKGEAVLGRKQCLVCHVVGKKGAERGSPLDQVGKYANPLSLAQDIWNHGTKMSARMAAAGIPRLEFGDSEMVDLFAYLKEVSAYETESRTYLMPGKIKIGERLFEAKGCFQCHRVGDKGKAAGTDLSRVEFHTGGTRIADKFWLHGPKAFNEMEQIGGGSVIFEGNEMADIASYMYFLRYIEQGGNFAAGKRHFTEKACVQCHSIRGRGGNVAMDLARSDKTVDYMKITTAMWNHNRKMRILMGKMGIPTPRFTAVEMEDLLFYLRSERLKDEF